MLRKKPAGAEQQQHTGSDRAGRDEPTRGSGFFCGKGCDPDIPRGRRRRAGRISGSADKVPHGSGCLKNFLLQNTGRDLSLSLSFNFLSGFELGENLLTTGTGNDVRFSGGQLFRREQAFMIGGESFRIEAHGIAGLSGAQMASQGFFEELVAVVRHTALSE